MLDFVVVMELNIKNSVCYSHSATPGTKETWSDSLHLIAYSH
jgi:hypothetical protein